MDDEAKESLRQWRLVLGVGSVVLLFVLLMYLSMDPTSVQYRKVQFAFFMIVAAFLVALVSFLRAFWRVKFSRK
jgi:uncharacterized integral membrane protein